MAKFWFIQIEKFEELFNDLGSKLIIGKFVQFFDNFPMFCAFYRWKVRLA